MYDDLYLNIYILTMASVLTVQDKYNVHNTDKNNKRIIKSRRFFYYTRKLYYNEVRQPKNNRT